MVGATSAIDARNFAAAEGMLREAISTGEDRGQAVSLLERVQVKPYTVAVRSVLVQPARLDGNAWVGRTSPLFFGISQSIGVMIQRGNMDRATAVSMTLPYENRPDLKIEAVMPDGARLVTPVQNGVYARFSGEFVIATNAFDDRRVAFRVLQGADG